LVISVIAVAVTVYFIDRSFTVNALADAGRSIDVPLWQGWTNATDVYRAWWDFDKAQVAGWLLAPVAAVAVAAWPNRQPIVT
jgi:hypothetical protein